MSHQDEWVSAADALTLLNPKFSTYAAAHRICERAYAGLIRARAEQFEKDSRVFKDCEIPKEFWWAKGHEALDQDWAAGDFSTWIEKREHWKAFGVTFHRGDLEKLVPSGANSGVTTPAAHPNQDLYLQLLHLAETAPDFTLATTPDMRRWLAQTRAAIRQTDDSSNIVAFETALGLYSQPNYALASSSTLLQCLYNALAHVGRNVPSSLQGAFVPTGNAHDALTVVGKILSEAKRSVMLVDPYADATILERYALFAPEGVTVQVLADSADAKPTLKPAGETWVKQYGASRPLSVRLATAKALHDRLIVLDESIAYAVGQSFNALATRAPTSINRIIDAETARRKIEAHRQIWSAGSILV